MENRKKIDDLFKNELGNYTETPPPAAWDALEKKLDRIPTKKPRVPYMWFGYFAMVVALVAISVLVARNIRGNSDRTVKNVAANNNISKEQKTTPAQNTNDNTATTANSNDKVTDTKPANDDPQATANQSTDNKPGKQTGTNKAKNEAPIAKNRNKHNRHTSAKYITKTTDNEPRKTITETEIQQPQNVYNSSASNSSMATGNKKTGKDESQEETSTDKKDPVSNDKKPGDDKTKKKTPKPKFRRFEAGIKGGYEQGFDNDAAKKAVISPYLQYKITPKLAIMLQPAIKPAFLSSRSIGSPKSYYNVNKDGNITQHTDSVPVHVIGTSQTFWIWNYTYTETHDSIVKTNVTGGAYIEFELPVLLKYYVAKDFSVYGGVNIIYSQLTGITEHTYIIKSLPRTATESGFGQVNSPAPAPPQTLSTEITYSGAPFSAYTGPQYPAPQGSLLRFGYMLGFSYEYNKKWLFDALVQQGMVQPNMQGGYNTNTPLSAPYIRLTIGYKLTK
ncbi:MAG: hypothetical protein ACHQD8_07060 [Chitinophagales bacterium]